MAQPVRKKTVGRATKRTSRRATDVSSKENTAAKLASMIEEHDLGLSQEEKNVRVAKFGKRVDLAIESRAKS